MANECRKIMPTRFNLVDELRNTPHPDNARACVCQVALESEIGGGTLPDRTDATAEDRQRAVDQACRTSFHASTSRPIADTPEQYVARARGRYEQDLKQVVATRQGAEASNRQLAENLRELLGTAGTLINSLLTYLD